MSKVFITSALALGLAMGATTGGHAAAGAAGLRAAFAPLDAVQLAQDVRRAGPGGAVVAPGGGPRVVAPRGIAPRAVGPRGVAPRIVAPRVVAPRRVIGRPVVVGRPFVRPYRPFYRRPWFGTVIGGIALGTFLTAATVGVAPAYAPAPGLCWYWADPSLTRGYWDYCQPPY